MKILRTANLGSNFTGSYKKRVYISYYTHYYTRLTCNSHTIYIQNCPTFLPNTAFRPISTPDDYLMLKPQGAMFIEEGHLFQIKNIYSHEISKLSQFFSN